MKGRQTNGYITHASAKKKRWRVFTKKINNYQIRFWRKKTLNNKTLFLLVMEKKKLFQLSHHIRVVVFSLLLSMDFLSLQIFFPSEKSNQMTSIDQQVENNQKKRMNRSAILT